MSSSALTHSASEREWQGSCLRRAGSAFLSLSHHFLDAYFTSASHVLTESGADTYVSALHVQ